MNLITYFFHDKVNHNDTLCELINIAYLIKVLVCVCVCKLFVRSTAGGLIERAFRWWARCQYFCAHCELVRGKLSDWQLNRHQAQVSCQKCVLSLAKGWLVSLYLTLWPKECLLAIPSAPSWWVQDDSAVQRNSFPWTASFLFIIHKSTWAVKL